MLPFFPTPYPDELLYSVFARYAVRAGNTSPKMTMKDLYGIATYSAVVDLPSHIDQLVNNFPTYSKLTAEKLIYNHTLFPFYAPFLPVQRFEMLLTGMRSDYGGNLHSLTGIMAGAFSEPRFLRFCPTCNQYDYKLYGEYYWHRIHQVPGVLVCPEHNLPLLDSTISYRPNNKHEYIPALAEHFKPQSVMELSELCHKRLYRVAMDCRWLLNHRLNGSSLNYFRDKYIVALSVKGLVSPKGFVDQTVLFKDFLSFFQEDTLNYLQSNINIEKETSWLRSIVRKHRKVFHPIRHILIMQYLSGSIKSFLTSNQTYKPFGDAPWPCLNPVATHYQQPVVTTVNITTCSDTGRPVGTFVCSCGFVYSRRGPDINYKDQFRFGRIKVFGSTWEAKLKEVLADQSLGLREVSRVMQCDPKSVVKYARKLGIPIIWNIKTHGEINIEVGFKVKNLDEQRLEWQKFIDEYPKKSISFLRRRSPSLYTWLYRYDREWLQKVSPRCIRYRNNSRRVDWESRDEIILIRVKQAIQNILDYDGKPKRITIVTIGKLIGAQALLEKHIDKLPKTNNFLKSSVESVEDFQCRRIRWVAKVLNSRGEQVRDWKIIRIAGLKSGFSKKIANEIEQQVYLYSPKLISRLRR